MERRRVAANRDQARCQIIRTKIAARTSLSQ